MTNIKTPAMLLQEYTVKKKFSAPEYNLIVNKSGTHENEFHYKVVVADIFAIGIGRSKQVAKHNAAFNALEILKEKGDYDIGGPAPTFTPNLHRNEPDNPNEVSVNSIGCLQDLCLENKVPFPCFNEISDVGPPHCRQFTYECQISSVKTQAIAKTKKQAKQLAAKLMLEKIKDMIPDLVQDDLDNALMEDVAVQNCLRVVSNKSAKIMEQPKCLVDLISKLGRSKDEILQMLNESTEEQLKKILDQLELEYEIIKLEETNGQTTFILSVSVDTSFAVLAEGRTPEEAKKNVLDKTFEYLRVYFSVNET